MPIRKKGELLYVAQEVRVFLLQFSSDPVSTKCEEVLSCHQNCICPELRVAV